MTAAELLRLDGRVAVVTGGATGMGRDIVNRLREAGARVFSLDLRPSQGGQDASDEIIADVTDPKAVAAAFDTVVTSSSRIDVLVNNAGIYPFAEVLDADTAVWRRTFAVNVDAAVDCARHAARAMIAQGSGGAIVNIGSVATRRLVPGLMHYGASKAALETISGSLAIELAPHGIRVNTVLPGGIDTPGYRAATETARAQPPVTNAEGPAVRRGGRLVNRAGRGDDVALAVLYLVSDMAAYVTGAALVVDGGQILS
jgi:NAD(P)-dependent dehydrogenase (short-subunit alcohol dehydrogenase family)